MARKNATATAKTKEVEVVTEETAKRTRTTKLTLKQMVEQGVLKAGRKIKGTYRDQEFNGTILKDGSVKVEGEVYKTPSGAATALCSAVAGKPCAINGLLFWKVYMDNTWVPMLNAREQ